jgi:outer membrane protein insertion porin family
LRVVKAVHIVILALAGMCAAAPQQSTSEAGIPPPSASIKPDRSMPAAATPSSGALARYEGLPVREIRIDSPSVMDNALLTELPQKSNQPLDRKKVRASVEKLFASRRFNDIQVQAEKDQHGEVTLVFVADENFFVNGVFVDGVPQHAPTATQLINATKLDLGELFTSAKLKTAEQNMKRLMVDNGFFHAEVSATDRRNPKTQQIDIFFHVVKGPLAKVGQVTFQGDSGFPEAELPAITKLHTGDSVSAAHVRRALERLRKRYQRRDRLEAQVAVVRRQYHEDTNTLDYVFGIERGPKIDVAVEGAHIRKGLIKRYVPIYEENAVDEDLLNEGRRNLRDYMQTKGYFDVNVDYTQKQVTPDERTIFFDINKGERHKLIAVVI